MGRPAASLLEAEVVTADGDVKIANACTNPDLFWALKGGGGGFGIVTRVTLRTHALPDFIGGVFATIKASSDDAYRRLIAKTVEFYAEALFNPHWGEQIRIGRGYVAISMVFQGLDKQQAEAVWKPFFDWVSASRAGFRCRIRAAKIGALPARHFWDPVCLKHASGLGDSPTIVRTRRPTTSSGPATSKRRARSGTPINPPGCRSRCFKTISANDWPTRLFAAAKHRGVSLHFNKGLAGATAEAIAAATDTAMNPAVVDAFALAITGAFGQPAYPDVPGHEPDAAARADPSRGR